MLTIKEIALHANKIQWTNGGRSFRCSCPAHADKEASLTVSEGRNGKIVLHCFAHCETKDILAAWGLEMSDINGGSGKSSLSWRDKFEYGLKKRHGDGAHIADVYDYETAEGKYLFSKVRAEGGDIQKKEIRYVVVAPDGESYESGKPEGAFSLYNIRQGLRNIREGFPVYYVEGEKDVKTLRSLGLVAVTAGSASDWRPEFARLFRGASLVILPDNDAPGMELADRIRKDTKEICFRSKVVVTSRLDKGDVTDYLEQEGGTKEKLAALVDAEEWDAAPWVSVVENKDGEKKIKGINPGLLARAFLRHNDFIVVRRPDDDKEDCYIYRSGVYEKMNKSALKHEIGLFIPDFYKRDQQLVEICGLVLSSVPRAYERDELNRDDRYINLRNGLLEVETGKLLPHTPKVLSTFQLDAEYHPDEIGKLEGSYFGKYLRDLSETADGGQDPTRTAVLQEYTGFILSNISIKAVKKALFMYSGLGNTGKSVFLNTISRMLGAGRYISIPINEMNGQNRFSLGNLADKRLITVGDLSAAEIPDSSTFKRLTGGDPVEIEAKGKQGYTYTYNGALAYGCNALPYFSDDKGGHLFERILIVPLEHSIRPEKRDTKLPEKLYRERNLIFSWAYEGLKRLRQNSYHFTECGASKAVTFEYREKSDTVFRFLTENYVFTGEYSDKVPRKEFDDNYFKWCADEDNQAKPVKKMNIKTRMEGIGCVLTKTRVDGIGGVMVYRGVRAKNAEEMRAKIEAEPFQVVTGEGQEELPFMS